MKVKIESEVAQLCPTLRDPMDCSQPGSSVHVIFQARVLEWGASAFSGRGTGSSQITELPTVYSPSNRIIQNNVNVAIPEFIF